MPEFGGGSSFVSLLIGILLIVSMWKLFEKADYPGWGAIIPIYNFYILVKIAGFSGISMLLIFVPFVNIVYLVLVYIGFAKAFGKDGVYAVGLILLSFVFFPLLAFGDDEYVGA